MITWTMMDERHIKLFQKTMLNFLKIIFQAQLRASVFLALEEQESSQV